MILILTALLFSVAAAGAVWLLTRNYLNKKLMGRRLAEVPGMSFPYKIHDSAPNSPKEPKKLDFALDKLGRDKITKDLFLAGLRQQKNIQFFMILLRMSLIIPACLLIIYLLTNSFTFKNVMVAVIIGVVIYGYVNLIIRMLKQKRQKQLLRSLPQLLDLIVVCVETGLSFPAALERILKEVNPNEPLTQEFSTMYHEYLGGLPLAQACERLDKRCEVQDLSVLLSAVVHSDQMGGSLGNTLRSQAAELRDKLRQRIRTRAFQIPVKILFPMMLIFLAFMFLNLGYIGYQMGVVIAGTTPDQQDQRSSSQVIRTSGKSGLSFGTLAGKKSY